MAYGHKGNGRNKKIKRILNILKKLVIGLLLLILIVGGLLLLPPVQTFLANKAVGILKDEFNIEAHVGRVKIVLPNRIELQEVYLKDDHNDTLIYVNQLRANYNGFDADRGLLKITKAVIDGGKFYMRKYPQDSLFNFAYFLEKLTPEHPDTNVSPFLLKISHIDIADFNYTKHRLGCVDSCTNIFIRNAKIKMDNFFLNGNYVSGDIKHMSFVDTARFELHDFRARVGYQAKYISMRDLYFKTDASEVEGFAMLEYEKGSDFNDFLQRVNIRGKFNQSVFSSDEFISYIPQFPKFDDFKFTGEFDGTVNDFEVVNCVVDMGEKTHFFGDIAIKNPTEVSGLQMKASIGELRTSPDEFKKYVGQYTGEMEWMNLADRFDLIQFRGKYAGTVTDFDVDGWVKLDENELNLSAKMNGFDNLETTTYDGFLAAKQIDIKEFLPNSLADLTKFKATIKGRGLTEKSIRANVDGKVDYIDFSGYRYQNLALNGEVSQRLFDGFASLNDPNAKVNFEGKIDFNSDTIVSDFAAHLVDINMKNLGFLDEQTSIFNLKSDIDFKIYKDSWWGGSIDFYDITYEGLDRFYFFDSLHVVSKNVNNLHDDRIESNIVNASLSGNYSWKEVYQAFYAEYLGFNRVDSNQMALPNINFDYDVELSNTELLSELLLPELQVDPGTKITGHYRTDSSGFSLNLMSDKIKWKKLEFDLVDVTAQQNDSVYGLETNIGSFSFSEQNLDSISFSGSWLKDSLWFSTNGIFRDSIDSYFRFRGFAVEMDTTKSESYFVSFDQGRFNVGNNYFDLNPGNAVIFKNSEIELRNFGFYDKESSIVINGFKSKDPTKVIRAAVSNLDADMLNYIVRYQALDFKGLMNGDVILANDGVLPRFASQMEIDSLWVNDDFIGNLDLESNWNIESGEIELAADIKRNDLQMFKATGIYYPDSTGKIDFNVNFNRFRLMWIDPFVDGILQNVRGTVTGDVKLTGNFKDINTQGTLTLQKAGLGVPYFNTDYSFDGEVPVQILKNKIVLPRTLIIDNVSEDITKATSGWIGGEITHVNFSDWKFNLKLDTENLLVLNTENSADAYFYGKAFAAGKITLVGPVNDLDINVDIKTNKGTDFKIPFSNPVNVGEQSFITYIGATGNETIIIDPEAIKRKELKSLGGLDIFINAEITSDANIELVMDETVGDVIRGRGEGNLRINIPHDGDLEMFGTVGITSGDYLFTMRNIINKKFVIVPGGSITWRGSPYDAIMKMKAKYSTRTTLTGIVLNNYDGQRVQVDLIMDLDGIVTNPNINFDIKLPNSNASYQEELNNRLSDPDKLNVQAFSLLVINTFWTETLTTEGNVIGQSAGSNTMQMASAQFSNWLAQGFGQYVDISVGYNTSSGTNEYSDEIEVDISKSFLDDRFTVNSRLDVPVGTSTASSGNQNFTGDVEVVYKITQDGRIKAKAFNRNNQDNPALDKLAPYTYGAGIFYTTSFNSYGELFRKIIGLKPKEVKRSDAENLPKED